MVFSSLQLWSYIELPGIQFKNISRILEWGDLGHYYQVNGQSGTKERKLKATTLDPPMSETGAQQQLVAHRRSHGTPYVQWAELGPQVRTLMLLDSSMPGMFPVLFNHQQASSLPTRPASTRMTSCIPGPASHAILQPLPVSFWKKERRVDSLVLREAAGRAGASPSQAEVRGDALAGPQGHM